jgi:replicative DNA helicase
MSENISQSPLKATHVGEISYQNRFDTEASLIGALFNYQDASDCRLASDIVQPEQFLDPFNARVFGVICQGAESGLSKFPLFGYVVAQMRDDATLAEIKMTIVAMIAKYVALSCPQIGISACARQVRHDWLNDKLKIAVEDGDTGEAELLAAEMERLSRAHLEQHGDLVAIGTTVTTIVDRLADLHQNGKEAPDYTYPGSHDLAKIIKGWRRGRFYVIAGRPGMGKSTTALSWLVNTARFGAGVMMFSLEMTSPELTEIALCDLAWTRHTRIEYRDLGTPLVDIAKSESRFERIREASERLAKYPFSIMDRGGVTIAEIRSQATQQAQRLAAQGKRLEVIAIDHLGLIKASSKYSGNKAAETEEISASIKMLAKELDVAVIALVQLNRGVESREEKRPSLSDLRWSGAIEQDADVVMFVFRESYYLTKHHSDMAEEEKRKNDYELSKNKLEIIWAKHRGGPCPTVDFFCDLGCGVVRDMEQ